MKITVLGLPDNLGAITTEVLRRRIIDAVIAVKSIPENTGNIFCIFPVCHGIGKQILLEVEMDEVELDQFRLLPSMKEDLYAGLVNVVRETFPNSHVGCDIKASAVVSL